MDNVLYEYVNSIQHLMPNIATNATLNTNRELYNRECYRKMVDTFHQKCFNLSKVFNYLNIHLYVKNSLIFIYSLFCRIHTLYIKSTYSSIYARHWMDGQMIGKVLPNNWTVIALNILAINLTANLNWNKIVYNLVYSLNKIL